MPVYSLNSMFDHLLESSHRDDSNKWSNIGFDEEITQLDSIEVKFTYLIWSSGELTDYLVEKFTYSQNRVCSVDKIRFRVV